jgi:pilus assembly protein FimV
MVTAVPAATPDLVKAFVGDVPAPSSANPPLDILVTPASSEAAPPAAAARAAGAPAPTDAAGNMLPPLEFEFPSTPESDPWGEGTQGDTVPGMQEVVKVADPVRTGEGLEFTVSLPDAPLPPPQLPQSQQAPLVLAGSGSPPEAGLAFTPPDLLAIETKVQEAAAVSARPAEASSLPTINMPIEATPESLEDGAPQSAESLPKINTNLDEEAAAAARGRDAHWQDVEQKFSLARAYLEIHDKEGAMEVLREAEREGDPRQKAEARHMLQEIK